LGACNNHEHVHVVVDAEDVREHRLSV
jgi:hypothetical protein